MSRNKLLNFSVDDGNPKNSGTRLSFLTENKSLNRLTPLPPGYSSQMHMKASDIWKRALQAHSEHQKKISQTTSLVMHKSMSFTAEASMAHTSINIAIPPPERQKSLEQEKNVVEVEEDAKPENAAKVVSVEKSTSQTHSILEGGIPWKKKLSSEEHKNPLVERQHVFQTFRLTGGEPPKTPPRIASEEFFLPAHSYPKTLKQLGFRGTDDMYQLAMFGELSSKNTAVLRPGPDFTNVSPKVNTGLHQLKKETKFTANGVPIHAQKLHPLTLGSNLQAKSLLYKNYKESLGARIAQIHNNPPLDPSMRNLSHLYVSTTNANRARQIAMKMSKHGKIGNSGNIQVLRPPTPNYLNSAVPSGLNFGKSQHDSVLTSVRRLQFQGPALSRYQAQHRNYVNSNRNMIAQYASPYVRGHGQGLTSQGLSQMQGKLGNNGQGQGQNHHNVDDNPAQKKYRPSQLLPLHIPGPKRANIYISNYSEPDREQVEYTERAKTAKPMKSRKR